MEYVIVIIAAMLAGIGTGLVGLSAATAMVPILIVLCPTFQGEHGAYMATAIALASDILGSAVIRISRFWVASPCSYVFVSAFAFSLSLVPRNNRMVMVLLD